MQLDIHLNETAKEQIVYKGVVYCK